MRVIRLAGAEIRLHESGLTETCFPGLPPVPAVAQDTPSYRARAQSLGYGAEIDRMSREHELTHAWLAHVAGMPHSPTMYGLAQGQHWPAWQIEEAAILAIQAHFRACTVDVVKLAERASASAD